MYRHAVLPVHGYGEAAAVAVVAVQRSSGHELKHDGVFGVMRELWALRRMDGSFGGHDENE